MGISSSFQEVNDLRSLIDEFGRECILTTGNELEYDPLTNSFSGGSEISLTTRGYFATFKDDIGDNIKKGMTSVYIRGDLNLNKFSLINGIPIISIFKQYHNDEIVFYKVAING
jgi:hypothetical protein